MGSLYRVKYAPKGWKYRDAAAAGTLREAGTWWLKYRDALGVIRRESSETDDRRKAASLLKLREGKAAAGEATPSAKNARLTVAALANVINDYRANKRPSLWRLEDALGHVLPVLGQHRASTVTGAQIVAYVVQRQSEGLRMGPSTASWVRSTECIRWLVSNS